MAGPVPCYRHPRRKTRVSCATCGRPICTECMVQTDVGIKCPDDARLPRGARAGAMKTSQVVRTFLAGAAVAILGIAVVYAIFQVGFLTLILSAVAGYGAGTLIHRAGGRKGGPLAMSVSGVAVAIAFAPFLALQFLAGGEVSIFRVLAAIVAVGFAVYNSR
ncbi:MAG: hypothetical protein H0U02_08840 [Rubrobacter sp.]|nr:hypothetical protein [Rubrobacter sp.]